MMIRTQIYLSQKQREFFKKEAQKYGIKLSEMIRRAMDSYIKQEERIGEKYAMGRILG